MQKDEICKPGSRVSSIIQLSRMLLDLDGDKKDATWELHFIELATTMFYLLRSAMGTTSLITMHESKVYRMTSRYSKHHISNLGKGRPLSHLNRDGDDST